MKLIVTGFKKLLTGKLSKFGKKKLLIRCTRPKSIALFIVGSWLLFMTICLLFAVSLDKIDKVGQFGDFFGSLNTLFSGAALAGVIVSLMMQRKELRLQRREMQLTRNEMKDQRTVWEQQTFDSQFFSLLSAHLKIKAELQISLPDNGMATGHNVFQQFKKSLNMRGLFELNKAKKPDDYCNNIAFKIFGFENYINSLELLFSTVHHTNFKHIDKDYYIGVIKQGISKPEQVPLFFYAASPSYSDLKYFVEKYALLKDVESQTKRKLDSLEVYSSYDPSAFGLSQKSPAA